MQCTTETVLCLCILPASDSHASSQILYTSPAVVVMDSLGFLCEFRRLFVLLLIGTLNNAPVPSAVSHSQFLGNIWSNAGNVIAGKVLSILVCLFEFSATVLTTIRCIKSLKISGSVKDQRGGFFYILLEQGILYFCLVSGFTVGATVLNFVFQDGFFLQRLLNALTLPISGMMTARFLLHLKKWEEKRSVGQPYSRKVTDIRFHHSARSTLSAISTSIVSEFGEDPVLSIQREADARVASTSYLATQEHTA
ncbi:hypothetical protein AX17_006719 [Amanita inopinata Kibby_2008]|nr:hypothetical protein AX17_006719 [Amanita inopinata Kibby_2008]